MAGVMNIPPHGNLKLYSNIDIGGGRQRVFQNRMQQVAYFSEHLVKTYDDLSYMRMGDKIRIEATVELMSQCNFLSFTNKMSGQEKEIYAYINPGWEYVNNNTVEISYTIASFQTIMFDMTVKPGIINREHLSEAEWAEASLYPFVNRHQLQTSEPLPFDRTMEKLYSASDDRMKVLPDIGEITYDVGVGMSLMLILGNGDFDSIQGWNSLMMEFKSAGGTYGEGTYIQRVPNISALLFMRYSDMNTSPDKYQVIWKKVFTIIEANNLTGNIMGLYYVPDFYLDTLRDSQPEFPTNSPLAMRITALPNGYNPRNPKLRRWPYSFLRIHTYDGQEKTYMYEKFLENVGTKNPTGCGFAVIPTLNGTPTIGIAPYKYIYETASTEKQETWIRDVNIEEILSYSDSPHIPYATDGYVSYLSTAARKTFGQKTSFESMAETAGNVINEAKNISNVVSSIVGAASGNPSAAAGASQSVANMQMPNLRPLKPFTSFEASRKIVSNPVDAFSGDRDAMSYNMGYSENLGQTLAKDNVYAGSGNGFLQYIKNPMRFVAENVVMRDDILEIYDKWLDYYGYASSRIGVPHVVSYFKGGDDQPHFCNVDGDQVTYAQATVSVYTNGKAPQMMAEDVQDMFRAGTLFVKG